jgi:hypothetical protein
VLLLAAGWTLVGGNLLPAGDRPGAQIMYEDAAGRRLTPFFTPVAARKDGTPRFATTTDLDMMSGTDSSLNCTIVAPIGRAEIKQIAAGSPSTPNQTITRDTINLSFVKHGVKTDRNLRSDPTSCD